MGNAAERIPYGPGACFTPIPFMDAHMLYERIESRMRCHEEACFPIQKSEAQDVHGR